MGVRFLHLSDLDLGARPSFMESDADSRAQEILETFREAVAFTLDPGNRIDAVLISGNLFDRHRPPADVWAFVRGLFGRLAAAYKPVVLIPGSRDSAAYKDSVYRTEKFPGADVLTSRSLETPIEKTIDGQRVFFYGACPSPGPKDPMFRGFKRVDEDGLHIGLVNGAVTDHPEWSVRPHDLVIEPAVLSESGLDYVALGGYHSFTPLHLDGTTAAYAGCLEGRAFVPGDLGRKSMLVVEVEPGNVKFEQRVVSRKVMEDWVIDLSLEQINDTEALTAALLARSAEDVVARITLTGSLEFLCDFEDVAESVRPRFHHLEVVDRTDLLGSALLRKIQGENTIRAYFVRRMLGQIQELHDRAEKITENGALLKQIEVARLALKIGLEQFLEEEPTPRIFEKREPERVETPVQVESEADAPTEVFTHPAARELEAVGKARALLRAERKADGEMTAEEGA